MTARALTLAALLPFVGAPLTASAQDVADPLTIQGLDQQEAPGARARALGGTRAAGLRSSAALFTNPAALSALDQAEVRLGGGLASSNYSQEQTWVPNRLYLELSLIFENEPGSPNPTRAFDDIRPDWDESQSATRPMLGSVAVPLPFEAGGAAFTAGLGAAQVANLDHYFQNNNALDPNIGSIRPEPIPRVQDGDSLMVGWQQFSRRREGAIYGITPALAVQRGPFSAGLSATVLTGSSDDAEQTLDRGEFTLRFQNQFSLAAPTGGATSTTGTSDYSGTRLALAGGYTTGAVSANVVWQPGYTLAREWTRSDGTSGTDDLDFASAFTLGASIAPSSRLLLIADADLRALGSAEFTTADTTVTPWISGAVFRVGAEFQATDWLQIRGGYHEAAAPFAAAGAALLDDPARADVFATGLGFKVAGVNLDLTYELSRLRYIDLWLSNANENAVTRHALMFEAAYALPFSR